MDAKPGLSAGQPDVDPDAPQASHGGHQDEALAAAPPAPAAADRSGQDGEARPGPLLGLLAPLTKWLGEVAETTSCTAWWARPPRATNALRRGGALAACVRRASAPVHSLLLQLQWEPRLAPRAGEHASVGADSPVLCACACARARPLRPCRVSAQLRNRRVLRAGLAVRPRLCPALLPSVCWCARVRDALGCVRRMHLANRPACRAFGTSPMNVCPSPRLPVMSPGKPAASETNAGGKSLKAESAGLESPSRGRYMYI